MLLRDILTGVTVRVLCIRVSTGYCKATRFRVEEFGVYGSGFKDFRAQGMDFGLSSALSSECRNLYYSCL